MVAILSLMGVIRHLPADVAFFIGAPTILVFPGIVISDVLGGRWLRRLSPLERLAVWFVLGSGVLSVAGFAGTLLHARLSSVALAVAVLYAILIVSVLVGKRGLGPEAGNSGPEAGRLGRVGIIVVLIAVGGAALTLYTPRDGDDWYYTAHLADYVEDKPIGLENAIFGTDRPAESRGRFGGWWVVEALLSRASGTNPVDCHQVYLPLLVVPLAIVAVFTLAMRILGSPGLALLAVAFHFLYLVACAYPNHGAGWMLLCRGGQDKTVCAFLVTPIAIALGSEVVFRAGDKARRILASPYLLFCAALVTSVIVHPLGPVWCGVIVVPFAMVELLRRRTAGQARGLGLLLIPFAIAGLYLLSNRSVLQGSIGQMDEVHQHLMMRDVTPGRSDRNVYVPGDDLPSEPVLTSPLVPADSEPDPGPHRDILRYPLTVAGLLLPLILIPRFRKSSAVRLLLVATGSVVFLALTPPGLAISGRLMSLRTVGRLIWALPVGLTFALVLYSIGLRPYIRWLVLVAVMLFLAKGNPAGYLQQLVINRTRDRAPEEALEALQVLKERPSPQGSVLAPETTSRYIAPYVPDGYPATYRGDGPLERRALTRILDTLLPDQATLDEIRAAGFGYLLLEVQAPLASGLRQGITNATLLFENPSYSLWLVPHDFAVVASRGVGKNVVLITIDSLRRDHLGCYGYTGPTSPNLDDLARRGVLFANVVCQAPQTIPSNASILTGLSPGRHGALGDWSALSDDHSTLAEIVGGQGYLTAAFVSSYALGLQSGLNQGFDVYWNIHTVLPVGHMRARYGRGRDPGTDAALDWLREYGGSRFMVWIHCIHPHQPYEPPPAYLGRFLAGPAGPRGRGTPGRSVELVLNPDRSDADLRYLVAAYDGEVAFADEQIGRLLEELRSLDIMDSTVVVVTSDHGEMLGDRDWGFGHERSLFDEVLMVPLVMHLPGMKIAGRHMVDLARSIDILPTVLDAAGLQIPSELEGRSLLPAVRGLEASSIDFAFSETFPAPAEGPPRHSVRTLTAKLIWNRTPDGGITKEFYDLVSDPGETADLMMDDAGAAGSLDEVLAAWIDDGGLRPVSISDERKGVRWKVLRRLGYFE